MPLSQPVFLFCLLWIWALTVLNHVRMAGNTMIRICNLPQASNTEDSLETRDVDEGSYNVVALPTWLKVVIVTVVQLPRIFMCTILLWLGSRWLVATLGFGDILLNAMALEFVLNLSELIYNVMMPYQSKLLVQRTYIPHMNEKEKEDCRSMFAMFSLGVLAAVWALVYIQLQQVLPDYRKDVHPVCKDYLAKVLAV